MGVYLGVQKLAWGYNPMNLTDTVCKNIKPKNKPFKLTDSGGLYLHVFPNGSKYWRLKYRFQKKEKVLALGTYPFISLAQAREERENAKKHLVKQVDPIEVKRQQAKSIIHNSENTFKCVALEWMETQKEKWSSNYFDTVSQRLEKDIFPFLGRETISKITTPDLLLALKKMEKRDALDLVQRCRSICTRIFRYAVQTGKCKANPANELLGAFKTRKVKHFNAISPNEIPELLNALEKNNARLFGSTRRAIKISLLTFTRPGELRNATWDEIDFDKKLWRIPAEKMKSRREHLIPLSKQTLNVLQVQKDETKNLNTNFVFPGIVNHKIPMSDGTVRIALQKLGFDKRMTAHGFRALARTAIREELNYEPDIIEAQLAHKPAGPLGAAYDRTKFIKQREKMMQEWADYLDRIPVTKKE
ncbi:MAG TPA: integrase arm-type DNA-binding domain-containing protein [Bacteroidia bacterium]|nr:integrase arm-type DNA-binding domain-containing protein [Bacteroidia bacterium]HRH07590.1 integrase arm-type DNA-binding domain-containing protein [Bacteroidia bacterium]